MGWLIISLVVYLLQHFNFLQQCSYRNGLTLALLDNKCFLSHLPLHLPRHTCALSCQLDFFAHSASVPAERLLVFTSGSPVVRLRWVGGMLAGREPDVLDRLQTPAV